MIELAGLRLERPRAAAPLLAGVDLAMRRGDVVLVTGGDGAALIADALHEAALLGAAVLVTGRDPHLVASACRLGWLQLMVHGGRLVDVTELVTVRVPPMDDVPEELVIEALPAVDVPAAD